MKLMFLTGGFVGFALTALTGVIADRDLNLVLRDSAIGCLIGALLFRWFWSVLVGTMRETVAIKARQAAAAQPPPTPSHR
jgi:formate/nitrite transporter FocA (FNT family)